MTLHRPCTKKAIRIPHCSYLNPPRVLVPPGTLYHLSYFDDMDYIQYISVLVKLFESSTSAGTARHSLPSKFRILSYLGLLVNQQSQYAHILSQQLYTLGAALYALASFPGLSRGLRTRVPSHKRAFPYTDALSLC